MYATESFLLSNLQVKGVKDCTQLYVASELKANAPVGKRQWRHPRKVDRSEGRAFARQPITFSL